jgi:hypothetical protein
MRKNGGRAVFTARPIRNPEIGNRIGNPESAIESATGNRRSRID